MKVGALAALLVLLSFPGLAHAAQVVDARPARPAGERFLGLEINQPPGMDHGAALQAAQSIGVGAVQLTLPWSVLEPDAGQLDVSLLAFGLAYYRAFGVRVLLSIPTLDTVEALLPRDLDAAVESGALRLSDPRVRARFRTLLTSVLLVAGPELGDLCLANEVDIVLAGRPQSWWNDLAELVGAGRRFVKTYRPDVRVGVSVTFGGLADARVSLLTASHDARLVTYYADGNFGGGTSGSIESDLQRMLAYADGKPLVLKECGYPTGPALSGSRGGQAAFLRNLFQAWDEHAPEIPLIVLSRMFDGVRADCADQAAYYGLPGDSAFIQFLCTLGLRTVDDRAKPAWDALVFEAGRRGF